MASAPNPASTDEVPKTVAAPGVPLPVVVSIVAVLVRNGLGAANAFKSRGLLVLGSRV